MHDLLCACAQGTYEFGANVLSEKYMLLGRISHDGRLSGRVKFDLANWLSVKFHCQLANDANQSQVRWCRPRGGEGAWCLPWVVPGGGGAMQPRLWRVRQAGRLPGPLLATGASPSRCTVCLSAWRSP